MPQIELATPNRWDVDAYFSRWAAQKLEVAGSNYLLAGKLLWTLGRYNEAVEILESAVDLLPPTQNELVGEAFYQLASVHTVSGAYPDAETNCRHAIRVLGPTTSHLRMSVFDLLGRVCGYQGKLEAAEAYHQECLRLCTEERREPGSAASSLHYLGRIRQARGDLVEAAECYQAAMDLFDKIGLIQGRALCLHQLGVLSQRKMDFASAREYYEKALGLRERLGDKMGIAASLHQLGCLHFFAGDAGKAIQMVGQSLEIERALNHLHGVSDGLAFLGYVYTQIGALHHALRHYEEALEIDLKLNRQSEVAEDRRQLDTIRGLLK
jgi:tetratricopeptide (TPR) repeat protein